MSSKDKNTSLFDRPVEIGDRVQTDSGFGEVVKIWCTSEASYAASAGSSVGEASVWYVEVELDDGRAFETRTDDVQVVR